MKILICSANYAPELTGVGKYSGEMAEWLAAQGHQVRVLAAPPYYPAWRVADEYRNRPYSREVRNGVQVWRVPIWVPRQTSGMSRVLHLMSFALCAAPLQLWCSLFWRPHVSVVVAPFFTAAPMAWLAGRLGGARTWLHVQDFEIDVAFNMGLLKSDWLKHAISAVERSVFRLFDRVSSISQRMLDRAAGKGVRAERLVYFRNWVDVMAVQPLAASSRYRVTLSLSANDRVVLFAGTLGSKQGLQIIPQVARLLASVRDIHFVICGDGPMKEELLRLCVDLDRVHFLPLQPLDQLGELLGLADIHLLPQDAAAEDLVLPSKLGGMLSSGRPVVATCAPGTEMAFVVQSCGVVVPPGDAAALAIAIHQLASDPCRCLQMGRAARQFAQLSLSREEILGRWQFELQKLLVR